MVTNIILDLKYTVFGKVIDGWDTLDALERLPVNPKNFKPVKGTFSFILNYSFTKTNIFLYSYPSQVFLVNYLIIDTNILYCDLSYSYPSQVFRVNYLMIDTNILYCDLSYS